MRSLPTGIADEQVFEGNVEVHTVRELYPERFAGPNGGGCSMSGGARPAAGRAVSGGFLGALALIGWWARQRGLLLTGVREGGAAALASGVRTSSSR